MKDDNFIKGVLMVLVAIGIISFGFISENNFPTEGMASSTSTEVSLENGKFVYDIDGTGDYSEIENILSNLYTNWDHSVVLIATNDLPSKTTADSYLTDLENIAEENGKTGNKVVITYDATDAELNFRTDSGNLGDTALYNELKNTVEAEETIDVDVDKLLELYIKEYAEKVKADGTKTVKQLEIELEKDPNGNEYRGTYAKNDEGLGITIWYPTRYAGDSIEFEVEEKKGLITLKEGCTIKYDLLQGIGGDYASGSLMLDENSLKSVGNFDIRYSHPSGDVTNRQDIIVVMDCSGYKDDRELNLVVEEDPVVIMIPGLWYGKHDYDPVKEVFSRRYWGDFLFFDYIDTNTDDVKNNAQRLSDFVDTEILKIWTQDNLKVGNAVTIVAHSTGSLIGRYYISELNGYEKVRKLITLGAPHLGTPLINIVTDACPPDCSSGTCKYNGDEAIRCADYFKMTDIIKNHFFMPPAYGSLGEVIIQLKPESSFTTQQAIDMQGIDFTLIAGSKPYAPVWIGENKITMATIATAEAIVGRITGLPESMKEYFHRFAMSFVG